MHSPALYDIPLHKQEASPLEPFEGISVSGQRWHWRTHDKYAVSTLMQQLQLPELLARILAGRGIDSDAASNYLSPTLKSCLPDPYHLKDMDKAVKRIVKAIKNNDTIAVFGDYDVDGATSSACLVRYLRAIGCTPLCHIPDRQKEGYGPNAPALLTLQQRGASLVITVDCGAVSFAPLQEAAQAGLDVIVIDHHKGAAQLPPAVAVVNPNRLDETSDYTHLAAVGVVFLTLVAVQKTLREEGFFTNIKEPNLLHLLDVVALGTICDVVPLTTLNRAFVVQGLKVMEARRNQGLAALIDHAGVTGALNAYHCGFVAGPRINAGGRVGQADLGMTLLTSDSPQDHITISSLLSQYNDERKAIEQQVQESAFQQASHQHNSPMILVHDEQWHPGVIGIVASRLKDRFHCPAVVISVKDGIGKASARSVHGVDIGAAIVAAREEGIVLEGGGHSMAGGFSIDINNIDKAHRFFNDFMARGIDKYQSTRALKLDAPITIAQANVQTIACCERAAPFGIGNPSPRLVIKNATITYVDILKEQHAKVMLKDKTGATLKAMAFRCMQQPLGQELLQARAKQYHIAGNLKLDYWQGQEQITFFIDDMMYVT